MHPLGEGEHGQAIGHVHVHRNAIRRHLGVGSLPTLEDRGVVAEVLHVVQRESQDRFQLSGPEACVHLEAIFRLLNTGVGLRTKWVEAIVDLRVLVVPEVRVDAVHDAPAHFGGLLGLDGTRLNRVQHPPHVHHAFRHALQPLLLSLLLFPVFVDHLVPSRQPLSSSHQLSRELLDRFLYVKKFAGVGEKRLPTFSLHDASHQVDDGSERVSVTGLLHEARDPDCALPDLALGVVIGIQVHGTMCTLSDFELDAKLESGSEVLACPVPLARILIFEHSPRILEFQDFRFAILPVMMEDHELPLLNEEIPRLHHTSFLAALLEHVLRQVRGSRLHVRRRTEPCHSDMRVAIQHPLFLYLESSLTLSHVGLAAHDFLLLCGEILGILEILKLHIARGD
mmetsp:Transcript_30323/g.80806  ORF Transcript_30323/g.80806 Transcript_30323/m.80806 type:complete len:396 (-) Transcript_30323:268-1455(-)